MEVAGGDLSPRLPYLLCLALFFLFKSLRHVADRVCEEANKKSAWFVLFVVALLF